MVMESIGKKGSHFVLVHGACHGAWSWHKLKHRLESEGHRVTAVDLAGSGSNPKSILDVHSFHEYTQPLLGLVASLEPSEKVILVGHSFGGMSLALAADHFPEKIAAAVFLTAFMPDTVHAPSYVLGQYMARTSNEAWLDTQFKPMGTPEKPLTSMLFGPVFLASAIYQLSPPEDLELAKKKVRPASLFMEELARMEKFSSEGYGKISRVYVICAEDMGIPLDFQRWMIKNDGKVDHVVQIDGADHMPMFSKPQELCRRLLEIAAKYD